MMNKEGYLGWLKISDYSDINDWNFQTIDGSNYFFIKHNFENKYALIKHRPKISGEFVEDYFEILVQEWTDYNGWGEE